MIEIQGQKILLEGRPVEPLDAARLRAVDAVVRARRRSVSGICRFYLQEVAPNFRLYVTPINIDPAAPGRADLRAGRRSSRTFPASSGLFYTTGFQEDYKARKNGVFTDDEFIRQAEHGARGAAGAVRLRHRRLRRRPAVLLLLQQRPAVAHVLVGLRRAGTRSGPRAEAKKYFGHVQRLYQRLDAVDRRPVDRYGSQATIIVMSDHGFANFGRQFNLNSWLRDWGYLGPPECTSIMKDVDWSQTVAYGLGINGLYLNLKGRERDGIVEPGEQREALLAELIERLEAVTDDGRPAGDPRRLSLGPDLLGQRDRAGAGPDHRLPPRLPRVLGHVPGRPDRRGPARQRLGLERRPLRRCAGGARRAVLQPADPRPKPVAGRPGAVDPGRVRTAGLAVDGRARVSFPRETRNPQQEVPGVVKIKIEPGLFDRAKRAAEAAGYSSVEEFIAHCIEKEIQRLKIEEAEGHGRGSASRPGIHRVMDRSGATRRLAQRRGQCPGTHLSWPPSASCRGGCRPRSSRR